MGLQWYTNKEKDYFINVKNIAQASIEEMNPIYIKLYEMSDAMENLIKESLFTLLKHLSRLYLKDTIYTLIKETVINGIKANVKRAIFFYYGLDINNPNDYAKGIKTFKTEMMGNYNNYIKRIKEENRYVMLRLYFEKDVLNIDVKNNSPLQQEELRRINDKIEKAKKFESMADLFTSEPDTTEGAGLGIGMIMFLLKNEGFGENSFTVKTDKDSTISTFRLPIELKKEQVGYKVAQKMLEEIDELPTFDINVSNIQKLIREPNSNISNIAEAVQKDLSLTSNLLKLANSAAFSNVNRVDNINQAIQLIGLRELSNMLYSIGTKRIMENRYSSFEEIWETSTEAAFICSKLAAKKNLNKELRNSISVAGLLHDIGRVILLSLGESAVRSVVKICGMRNEPPDLILEEAVIGISHPMIGGLISKKWNFPNNIQKAIELHHTPYLIKDNADKDFVYPVYLADKVIEFNQGLENFEKIYKPCLDHFGFDKTTFIKFAVDCKREYIRQAYKK